MTSLTREDIASLVEAVCRGDENAFHDLIEASPTIVPLLIEQFKQKMHDGESRARIVEVIWQRRESESTRFLSMALEDSYPAVWKEAIDGLVTIGGREARHMLTGYLTKYPHDERAAWVHEALEQLRD
ncbi:MAG: HEAT repeat domain-containing protein [Pirellulaceae bacterium]